MNTNKTFSAIVSQPTVRDGSLKSGLALTKLVQAGLDVTLSGSVTVQGKSLELAAIVAASLLPAFDDKYSIDLDTILTLYNGGFVTPLQQQIAKAGISTSEGKKPLPVGSVITAQEYMEGNIKTAKLDQLKLYNTIQACLSGKPTNEQLRVCLSDILDLLFSPDMRHIYAEKLRKEQELEQQFSALTELGFTSISPLKDDTFKASLALTSADKISSLAALGYILKDSSVDMETASITVVFNRQPADKIA